MVEWRITDGLTDYTEALAWQEARVEAIRQGQAEECLWLLEHPPLYTAGTSAKPQDLLWPDRFPVYDVGRGGQYTYHGPGQRVVYVMLDLKRRGGDVRRFVHQLESWVVAALAEFNVHAVVRPGRVGVWVPRPDRGSEDKIAALGIRLRGGVSFHGLSINIDPELSHFQGIVPCGITDQPGLKLGVTSLVDLGLPVSMTDFDLALAEHRDLLLKES